MKSLLQKLDNRPDTEHQAALVRLTLALIVSCYMIIGVQQGIIADNDKWHVAVLSVTVVTYSIVILICLLIYPQISIPRRVLSILVDVGATTYALYFLGDATTPFFGIYLLNACGNGFRFGPRYLYLSSALSITGFTFVLITSEYWVSHQTLGIGLLIVLITIPMYFASLVRQLHTTLAYMRTMATHDTLTLLPNRHLFIEKLQHLLTFAEQSNGSIAVMFIDLDGFKPINDTLGHAAGDMVLKSVAKRLKECVRPGDIVARFGGDEFVVVLSGISKTEIPSVTRKIIHTVATCHELNDKTIMLSSSVGIAIFPDSGRTADALIAQADAAMYRSKRAGKNCFCLDGGSQTVSTLSSRTSECRA